MEKAILVVSFGTSYEETRKKTIDCIEQEIQAAYPEYQVYRAWTSKMIMKKLKVRDGVHVMNVREAMEQMEKDGIKEVIVQPTHVMNGYENDRMTEDANAYSSHFSRVAIGAPLLSSVEDQTKVIEAAVENLPVADDEALVLMGHGTEHFANSIYAALDYQFKDMGHPNVFVGTVEGYPELENVKKLLKKSGLKKVVLAPFMIVAGDHATNDLAGDEEDSWKSLLKADGYEVRCILKGLGEYPQVRSLFVDHIAAVKEYKRAIE